jgi:hypothetical protein
VNLRPDGRPRWEVKVRWSDANGKTVGLPTRVFPFDPGAKSTEVTSRKNALDSANRYAIEERAARRIFGKPRAELPSAWTLGTLLERLLDESRAEVQKRLNQGKRPGDQLEQRMGYARMLTGIAHREGSRATVNTGFPDLCLINLRDLTPAHFGGGPQSLASRLKGRDGGPAPADSVRRLIGFLSWLFQHARKEWGIACTDPLANWKLLDLSPSTPGRTRTVSEKEWVAIQGALSDASEATRLAIRFARHTAARRSESSTWTGLT